ncbi:DNase I-like protein [Clavulina sp. PMI_390]|nr:DNase I-like protein [Clavulina sp. PMI_390]
MSEAQSKGSTRPKNKFHGFRKMLARHKPGDARTSSIGSTDSMSNTSISQSLPSLPIPPPSSPTNTGNVVTPTSAIPNIPANSPPSLPPLETHTLFSRFHSFFPLTSTNTPSREISSHTPFSARPPPKPRTLKLRIVSWNMHDGLPSGDLEQLLGKIPAYQPCPFDPAHIIPDLGEGEEHPYHILVVAGQECPSLSGLPMAFGAGYKIYDRDRKSHRRIDSKSMSDPPQAESSTLAPSADLISIPLSPSQNTHFASTSDLGAASHGAPHPGGWSHLLDDWLVHGNKVPRKKRNSTPVASPDPSMAGTSGSPSKSTHSRKLSSAVEPQVNHHLQLPALPTRSITSPPGALPSIERPPLPSGRLTQAAGIPKSDPDPASSSSAPAIGPYELACKERMMGIYLAVYVHRDVKPLIKGVDKHAVTAGLIGGRVGNKGGVGISLNVNGTTFLFINAHLAAHGNRVQARMANLAKIKAELELDHFLPADDERSFAEDITDRYDHSFIFGDLNFRLDVSRLHADWLIKQKDYAQALTFDQLLAQMNQGQFPGFQEAAIDFAPTFKYDVDHGEKLGRRKTVSRAIKKLNKERRAALREWRGKGASAHNASREDVMNPTIIESDDDDSSDREVDDQASLMSAVLGSTHLSATDAESSASEDEDDHDSDHAPSIALAAKNAAKNARVETGVVSDVISSVVSHPTTRKAKSKWRALLSKRPRGASDAPRNPASASASQKSPPPPPPQDSAQTAGSQSGPQARRSSAPPAIHLVQPSDAAPPALGRPQTSTSLGSVTPSISISAPAASSPLSQQVSPLTSEGPLGFLRPWLGRGSGPASISSSSASSLSHTETGSMQEPARDDSTEAPTANHDVVAKPGRYDTSSKKRVPSWCDRIIFKTTVEPPLDEEEDEIDDRLRGSRSRKFGQFLLTPIRTVRTSLSKSNLPRTESLPNEASIPFVLSPLSAPGVAQEVPHSSPFTPKRERSVTDSHSPHNPSTGTVRQKRSMSLPHDSPIPRARSSPSMKNDNATSPSLSQPGLPTVRLVQNRMSSQTSTATTASSTSRRSYLSPPTTLGDIPENLSSSTSAGPPPSGPWMASRRWISTPFQLLSNVGHRANPPPTAQSETPPDPTIPHRVYRKGDVDCLHYGTLDDQGMARLQGRSDHRPIIGVYSIVVE